jgi:hypothetical protein
MVRADTRASGRRRELYPSLTEVERTTDPTLGPKAPRPLRTMGTRPGSDRAEPRDRGDRPPSGLRSSRTGSW